MPQEVAATTTDLETAEQVEMGVIRDEEVGSPRSQKLHQSHQALLLLVDLDRDSAHRPLTGHCHWTRSVLVVRPVGRQVVLREQIVRQGVLYHGHETRDLMIEVYVLSVPRR